MGRPQAARRREGDRPRGGGGAGGVNDVLGPHDQRKGGDATVLEAPCQWALLLATYDTALQGLLSRVLTFRFWEFSGNVEKDFIVYCSEAIQGDRLSAIVFILSRLSYIGCYISVLSLFSSPPRRTRLTCIESVSAVGIFIHPFAPRFASARSERFACVATREGACWLAGI